MDNLTGLLIDIDGVLVVSHSAIEGAVAAVTDLRDRRMPVRFLTNNTSTSTAELSDMLRKAGFEIQPQEILTAPVATAAYLQAHFPRQRCFVINDGDLGEDFEGIEVVEQPPAEVVVIGGAGPVFTYEALNLALRCLHGGAALVGMHRNLVWPTEAGLQLDSGGFLNALEASAGVEAVVVGKPAREFFQAGLDSLGLEAGQVAMIGDDLVNDVLAAQAVGITGIQVRTGKFSDDQLSKGEPDHLIDSIAEIISLL